MVKRLIRAAGLLLVLALAGYIVWDRVEAHRMRDLIAGLTARGEPVSLDYWTDAPRTPAQHEAASLYAQAAAAAREEALDDNNRPSRLDVDKPAPLELSLDEIRSTYRPDAGPLQLLDRATPLDFNGFDPDDAGLYNNGVSLEQLGDLAGLRADLFALDGRPDAAADALVPVVRLQRTLLSPLYRSQRTTRLLGSLRILLRHGSPSDAALVRLQHAFDSWSDEDPDIQYEAFTRAQEIDFLDQDTSLGRLGAFALHPAFMRFQRAFIVNNQRLIDLARQPWPVKWAAYDAAVAQLRTRLRTPVPSLVSRVWRADINVTGQLTIPILWAATDLAGRRLFVTALAIERYRRAHGGAPPSGLNGLVPGFLSAVPEDPFAAAPLHYRVESGGYVLYSLDSNRRDDGGAIYGFGSAVTQHVGPQSPRDLGLRVPATPVSSSGRHGS